MRMRKRDGEKAGSPEQGRARGGGGVEEGWAGLGEAGGAGE